MGLDTINLLDNTNIVGKKKNHRGAGKLYIITGGLSDIFYHVSFIKSEEPKRPILRISSRFYIRRLQYSTKGA